MPDAAATGPAETASVAARRPATDSERRAVASVVRLRILRLCLYEELTNREIADRLGRNPATVLHHVRTLLDQGFLVAGPMRRGRRGSREIPYRATGKSWALSWDDLPGSARGPDATTVLLDTFLAEIAEVDPREVDTSRLGLQLSEEHWAEFTGRMRALLDEYANLPHDPGGKRWSLFLAMHPEQ